MDNVTVVARSARRRRSRWARRPRSSGATAPSARPSRTWPTGSTPSPTRSCAASRPASRAAITATGVPVAVSDPLRRAGRGSRPGRGWSAARCATGCSAGPTSDYDVVVGRASGRSRTWPAGWAAPPAGSRSRSRRRFGAWRVVAHDRSWQVDLSPLGGDTIEADLGRRDLTVNAIAEPLGGRGAWSTRSAGSQDLRRAPAADGLAGGVRRRPAADAAPGAAGLRAGLRGRARDAALRSRQRARAGRASPPSGSSPSSSAILQRRPGARRARH